MDVVAPSKCDAAPNASYSSSRVPAQDFVKNCVGRPDSMRATCKSNAVPTKKMDYNAVVPKKKSQRQRVDLTTSYPRVHVHQASS
jgi:hypothetical protein